jgi:hypothetical protein
MVDERNLEPGVVRAAAPPRRVRKRLFSILFLIAAVALTLYGLRVAYRYGTEADKIVGGDAYNFIIMAARGTAWVCAGVVSALASVVFALFDVSDRQV